MIKRIGGVITTPKQPKFFQKQPPIYLMTFEQFQYPNSFVFNLTKQELKDLKGSKLIVSLSRVDFAENYSYTNIQINLILVFYIGSLISYTLSCIQKFRQREFLVPELLLLVINWLMVKTSIEGRVMFQDGLFNFLSAVNTLAFLVFICIYCFILKLKHDQRVDILDQNYIMFCLIILFICTLNLYVVAQIESVYLFTSLMPVVSLILRCYSTGKNLYSKSYIFCYQPLQILLIYVILRVKPPYSLYPDDSDLSNVILVYSWIVYSFVLAQTFYHPKLCKKAQFLEWKKWVPTRMEPENIPVDAECNICLEKFGKKFKKIREKRLGSRNTNTAVQLLSPIQNKENEDLMLIEYTTEPQVEVLPQQKNPEGLQSNDEDKDLDTSGEISEYVETRCGHKYCLKCLETWLKVRNKCAVCGAKCYSIFKTDDDAQAELDQQELQEIQENIENA